MSFKLFFFYDKISQVQKSTKRIQGTKKYQKALKSIKHNQAKAQNANKRIKIKNALKKHLSGKK